MKSCLANSPSVYLHVLHSYTPLLTLSALNECLLVHNFLNSCFTECHGTHLTQKIIVTKESVYIRKEFKSHRIDLEHQHGSRFTVLEHQYGRREVM